MIKLFVTVLMLIIAATAFFGYTNPAYSHVKDLQGQASQLDQILSEASEFQRLKSALLFKYNSLPSDQLVRLQKLLPDHVDNVRLILDVDSLAAKDGLSLENVIINAADDGSGSNAANAGALGEINAQNIPYDSLTLQFRTSGSYEKFVQFMRELEASLRLVDVVELSASANAADSKSPTYSFNVKVRTYWLK